MLNDLLLGFFLSKLFGKDEQRAAASPAHLAHTQHTAATTHARAHAHTHVSPGTFPADVIVPVSPTAAPQGFKKAVEVWGIRPDVAAQAAHPLVIGAVGEVNEATAIAALEASFPAGWAPVTSVTAAEQQTAIALTSQWHDGGVLFFGPETYAARRAYRMTKHPADGTAPAAAPIPVPMQPGVTVPADVPIPITPAPAPVVVQPASAPVPTTAAPPTLQNGSSGQYVTVLQTKLHAWGDFTKMKIDGKFGPITKAAVQTFQSAHGLANDGIVGPQTWAALGGPTLDNMPAPAGS